VGKCADFRCADEGRYADVGKCADVQISDVQMIGKIGGCGKMCECADFRCADDWEDMRMWENVRMCRFQMRR
jgi:hypothetical protein